MRIIPINYVKNNTYFRGYPSVAGSFRDNELFDENREFVTDDYRIYDKNDLEIPDNRFPQSIDEETFKQKGYRIMQLSRDTCDNLDEQLEQLALRRISKRQVAEYFGRQNQRINDSIKNLDVPKKLR